MFLYSGLASSSFMNLIQVFWLVALGVADRMAMSPVLSICLASSWTSLRPRSSALAWLTKIWRPSGAVSESKVTTLTSPPNSLTAARPPALATVKYGLLSCLGRKAILRPCLIWAFGLAAPALVAVAPPPEDSLVVPPQAARTRAQETAMTTDAQRRRGRPAEVDGCIGAVSFLPASRARRLLEGRGVGSG